MGKIKNTVEFLKKIDLIQYIKLNFCTQQIIRQGQGKIVPYKNSIIDFDKTAKIYIQDDDIEIGTDQLKRSKTETYIRLHKNAIWDAKKGCRISYGSTIEVLENAQLKSDFFTMNSWGTLIAKKYISLGQDVMIARRAIIFDSDFHPIMDEFKIESEISKEVIIGKHVWIGANSVILKGVKIGDNSIIAANSLVTKDIMNNTLVGVKSECIVLKRKVEWRR